MSGMETILLEGTLSCKAMIETHPGRTRILYTDEKKRTRDFSWIIRKAREAGIPVVPCSRKTLDERSGTHPGRTRILYTDEKKRTRDFSWIIRKAREAGIPVVPCSRKTLDERSGSKSHGGMLLETEPVQIPELKKTGIHTGFVCYVEGVEDPHNLGSVCRTLYAAGCSLLVLPARNWDAVQPVVMRASAGTFARLSVACVQRPEDLTGWMQSAGIPILCAERKDARPVFGFPLPACSGRRI